MNPYPWHNTNFNNSSDPLLGPLLDTSAFNGWWIIFWFILGTCFIVFFSKRLSDYIQKISENTRLSKGFIGGTMLSIATSLPELVASIYAAISDKPQNSVINVLGANSFTTFILGAAAIYVVLRSFYSRRVKNPSPVHQCDRTMFEKVDSANRMMALFVLIIVSFLMLNIYVPAVASVMYIPGLRISIAAILPFALYILFLVLEFRNHKKNIAEQPITDFKQPANGEIKKYVLMFVLFAVLLLATAYLNSAFAHTMPHALKISENTAIGFFLAFSGALPETLTLIFLVRKHEYGVATGGILGSHLFNLSILFISDLIIFSDTKGSMYQITELVGKGSYDSIYPWLMMAVVMSLSTFTIGIPQLKGRRDSNVIYGVMMTSIYVVGFVMTITIYKNLDLTSL